MTNAEFVSLVWNDLRTLNRDEHLPRRHILETGRKFSRKIIAQKLKEGTLFREDSLFSHIKCFELESVDSFKCDIIEFQRCEKLMKSKKRLPDLVSSRFGPSVILVASLNGQEFNRTTPSEFADIKYSRFPKLKRYLYYVEDGFLYLPGSEVEAVNLVVLTMDTVAADEVSGCSTCDECESGWDKIFVVPSRSEEDVVRLTIQELSQTWRQIIPDENPDKDQNIRSQKTV